MFEGTQFGSGSCSAKASQRSKYISPMVSLYDCVLHEIVASGMIVGKTSNIVSIANTFLNTDYAYSSIFDVDEYFDVFPDLLLNFVINDNINGAYKLFLFLDYFSNNILVVNQLNIASKIYFIILDWVSLNVSNSISKVFDWMRLAVYELADIRSFQDVFFQFLRKVVFLHSEDSFLFQVFVCNAMLEKEKFIPSHAEFEIKQFVDYKNKVLSALNDSWIWSDSSFDYVPYSLDKCYWSYFILPERDSSKP